MTFSVGVDTINTISCLLCFCFRMLSKFAFNLTTNWELTVKKKAMQDLTESVTDVLIKHHLFSWEI